MTEYLASVPQLINGQATTPIEDEAIFSSTHDLDVARDTLKRQAGLVGATLRLDDLTSLSTVQTTARFLSAITSGLSYRDPSRFSEIAAALGLDWTPATLPSHDQQAGAAFVSALDYVTRTNRADDLVPWPAFRAAWHRRDYGTHAAGAVANGYSTTLPIRPGQKSPALPAWSRICDVEPSAGERATMLDTFAHCGLGIAGGRGFLWLDVDQPAQADAWRAELAVLAGCETDALPVRVSPKVGRFAYLLRYRAEPGERVPNGAFIGNDVRGHGAQVVVMGAHPSGDGDYQTHNWHPATTPASFHYEIDWTALAGLLHRVAARCGIELDQTEMQIATLDRSRFPARAAAAPVEPTLTISSTGSTGGSDFLDRAQAAAERNPGLMLAMCFPGQNPVILSDGSHRYVAHWTASGRGVAMEDRVPTLAVYVGASRFSITDYGDSSRGYNTITLVAAALGVSKGQAVAKLASLYGIEQAPAISDQQAAAFLAHNLGKTPAPEPVVEPAPAPVTLEESTALIRAAISDAITASAAPRRNLYEIENATLAPFTVLRARPATGKTRQVIGLIGELFGDATPKPPKPRGAILYVAPFHEMALQVYLDLQKLVPKGHLSYIAGRSYEDEDGPYCQRKSDAMAISAARPGENLTKALCDGCPFYKSCRYLAQVYNQPKAHLHNHVYVTTHAGLLYGFRTIPHDIALTIIDEDITAAMLPERLMRVGEDADGKAIERPMLLNHAALAFGSAGVVAIDSRQNHKARPVGWHDPKPADVHAFGEVSFVLSCLGTIEPNSILTADRMTQAGLTLEVIEPIAKAAALMREFTAPPLLKEEGGVAMEFACSTAAYWRHFAEITNAMRAILADKGSRKRLMLLGDPETGKVAIRLFEHLELHAWLRKKPLIVLDGTSDVVLLRLALGREISSVIDAWPADPEGVRNVAILDTPASAKAMRNRRNGVADGHKRVATAIAQEHHGNVGVISTKAALSSVKPSGVRKGMTAHYGAVAGLNRLEKVRALTLHGRDLPPIIELVAQALALTNADLVVPYLDYSTESRTIRMRDGSSFTVTVSAHPDPIVNALLRRTTDAQILQAAERGRSARRSVDKPLDVFFATGRLHDRIVIDEVIRWGETVGSLAHDVLEEHGFLPMGRPGVLPALCTETPAKAWPDMAHYPEKHGWPNPATRVPTAHRTIDLFYTVGRGYTGSDMTTYAVTEPRQVWHVAARDGSPTSAQAFIRQHMQIFDAHVEGAPGDKALASFARIGIATDSVRGAATLDPATWPTSDHARKSPGGLLDPLVAHDAAPTTTVLYRVMPSGASKANAALVVIDLNRHVDPVVELAHRFVSATGRAPRVELTSGYVERLRRLKANTPQTVRDLIANCQVIINEPEPAATPPIEPITDADLMAGDSLPEALMRLMLTPAAPKAPEAADEASQTLLAPWHCEAELAPGILAQVRREMGMQ